VGSTRLNGDEEEALMCFRAYRRQKKHLVPRRRLPIYSQLIVAHSVCRARQFTSFYGLNVHAVEVAVEVEVKVDRPLPLPNRCHVNACLEMGRNEKLIMRMMDEGQEN